MAAYLIISALARSVVTIGKSRNKKRSVDPGHDLRCAVDLNADHNPIRLHKIVDRSPFAQKFRVRNYIEMFDRVFVYDPVADLGIDAQGQRRFGHKDKLLNAREMSRAAAST